MKNLIYGTLFLTLIGIVAMGCTREDFDEENLTTNTTENTVKDKTSTNKLNATVAAVKISCSGSCNGSGDVCGMRIQGTPVDFVECDCEGCTMSFSAINNIPIDQTLSANFKHIAINVENYFNTNYPNNSMIVSAVDFYKKHNNDVVIQVDYKSNNQAINANITYLLEFSDSGALNGKTEIQCSGGCDKEAKTCRERYYPSSGAVECTCQGACSMSVNQLPN